MAYSHVPCVPAVSYLADGSGAGLNDLLEQNVDFAATDVPLTDATLARSQRGPILHIPVTLGSAAVIYHVLGVPSQLRLTGSVLADIFLGKITAWNDPAITQLNPGVSLPPLSITVIHRSDGSGTTGIFTHYLAQANPAWNAHPISGYSWVIVYQQQDDIAIGQALVNLFWWMIHNGQRYAAPLNYAALPDIMVTRSEAQIRLMTCGNSPCYKG